MKRTLYAVFAGLIVLGLTGCGGGGDSPPPIFTAQIFSDSGLDGDIEQTSPNSFLVVQGMSPTIQSVFAGTDPLMLTEFRAFLQFPLSGPGGVPGNAIIQSAFLNIFINSIQPFSGTTPMLIELVSFQPPTLLPTDFNRTLQPPLALTRVVPPISPADVGNDVAIDVTALMVEAQRLGLSNFQLRILEDLQVGTPVLVEINDSTGANRSDLAPLLTINSL
ncbi:MAG: hypothetical protein ABI633_02590 [Burkholderiales bacterium]